MTNQEQVKWLRTIRYDIGKLMARLKWGSDINLPRGFALGCCQEACVNLSDAMSELTEAINERKGQ